MGQADIHSGQTHIDLAAMPVACQGERREVGPGDGILIPPGARHSIRNIAQDPLVFLCCCSPPYAHEDTVLVE